MASQRDGGPVLLTGATGFLGRRIQRALLADGRALRVLVRPGSPSRRHVDARCEIHETELGGERDLGPALHGCRAVVYCAGSVRGRTLNDFLPANVEGVRNILQAMARRDSAPPFLLISSLAAGRPELSHYAHSKRRGEEALHAHATGPWTVLRPPPVYGPGDRELRPILRMARRGLVVHAGPRDQRVSLLYADDLASAVLAWLRSWPDTAGGTYAIDDGRPGGYDWPAIAAAAGHKRSRLLRLPSALLAAAASCNLAASRLFGYAPMLTPGKVRELTEADWLCDNSAFTATTGWRPQTDLARGLRLTFGESYD
jgi:nucleoside-diphosphate-sugar epimerase